MTATRADKIHRSIALLLFLFLLVYLGLRTFLLDTLHDEVASYMFFFYQGDFWGETIQWDANNHLLNSAIGHILYRLFGDHFGILRLPNLLAFIAYFWAAYRLTFAFRTPWLRTSGLFALTTIPFVMEYFGNARGYGLSLGFFAWALVHGFDHLKHYSLKSLFYCYALLVLAVSANLTLLNTCGLMALIFFLYPLLNTVENRVIWKEWLLHLGFGLALIPFVLFGMALRQTGALYYGSLDGLWDVTGKTLSRYVLFYDPDFLLFVWLGIFALCFVAAFILFKRLAFRAWLREPAVLLGVLFFGNLILYVLLAKVLLINYPEDRTAMYLIPVFLLMLMHLIEHFPGLRLIQWSFLFFPASLVWHLSLETSVFSPDDRMNSAFFAEVKKEIQPEHSIMIYHIMNWNWPYQESHYREKASVAQFDNFNSTLVDILVTKTTMLSNPDVPKLYDTIAHHPASTYIAFKRKQPMIREFLMESETKKDKGNLEYIGLESIASGAYAGKNLQVSVKGHMKTIAPFNKIQLVVETQDGAGTPVRHYYYSFETTYQSQLINDDFLHHFTLEKLLPEEKQIKVYLWNRALHLLQVRDFQCTVFELIAPEHGTR